MRLTVNGELFDAATPETISGLLRELEIDSARVAAVEVNLAIVRKADFSAFMLKDGDQVEIVNFVGGG
jgi:sulfur carrier protein